MSGPDALSCLRADTANTHHGASAVCSRLGHSGRGSPKVGPCFLRTFWLDSAYGRLQYALFHCLCRPDPNLNKKDMPKMIIANVVLTLRFIAVKQVSPARRTGAPEAIERDNGHKANSATHPLGGA